MSPIGRGADTRAPAGQRPASRDGAATVTGSPGQSDNVPPVSETAARDHVERFNAAVTGGDWTAFVSALHPAAVMTFVGPPVGPFHGRHAIAAAYVANPPGGTMCIVDIESKGDSDVVTFAWSRGGTGILALGHRDGQIAELTVTFDAGHPRGGPRGR